MTTSLYPFQSEDAHRAVEEFNGRCLLGHEMGCGKGVMALAARKLLGNPTTIIVCPASLKFNWERECKKHFGVRAQILSSQKPPRKPFRHNPKIVIINYDILPFWVQKLQELDIGLIISDESQMVSNGRAKRSKATKQLSKGVPYFLALSGTPFENRPSQLWHILHIIRPDLFPSFLKFAMNFCAPKKTFFGWDFKGASHTEELHDILTTNLMIRRRKEDVLDDLPPKTRTVVPLEVSNYDEYLQASENFVEWLTANYGQGKLHGVLKAAQLTQLGYLKRLASKIKYDSVVAWIENFLEGSDQKLMVFGVHKAFLGRLHAHFGRPSTLVTGAVLGKKRQDRFDRFNDDPHCRLFLGNVQAAGVGWSCTSASNVAFAEMGWKPAEHVQAEDRARGLFRGVKGMPTNVYYLVARKTVEEILVKLIQKKAAILSAILDGGQGDEMNIFDLLSAELLKQRGRL